MRDETAAFIDQLRERGGAARAEWDKRYMKSERQHWGVSTPEIVAAIRTLRPLSEPIRLRVATELWREGVFDLRIAAARIVAGLSDASDPKTWRFLTDRMPELDGWAIADNFADAAGPRIIFAPGRLDEVERWTTSPHLWTRRASLVFTLAWMRSGRSPERMLGWAARLVEDREWFIQKAIGWWLRELGKRDAPRVRAWLKAHGAGLKAFARKEAEKYLSR
jgi:3-methyladenine DNA glycosylase AlkD